VRGALALRAAVAAAPSCGRGSGALDTATFTPPNAGDQNAVQSALDESTAVLGTATMRGRSDPNGPTCN
jgi:hypothetical protein